MNFPFLILAAGAPAGAAPPPYWSFIPFITLLLCIAILPLIPRTEHWWHKNGNKLLVGTCLGFITLLYYFFISETHPGMSGVLDVLNHAVLKEYLPFIVLLFSLYVISGGVLVTGDLEARPIVNCAFLGTGAILASFIGTTGASVLLIRPLLKTNSERKHVVHTVVFFIFIVSNIGGCLTPLGDPPLFLGFLKGVPFTWTFSLWPDWAIMNAVLLGIYFLWDSFCYFREARRDILADEVQVKPLRISGTINFLWLLGVVGCVGFVNSTRTLPFTDFTPPEFTREVLLLALSALSWRTTRGGAAIRAQNRFTFFPIAEVACLFIGIFVCMQAPVEFLRVSGGELGIDSTTSFFWATGILSSFLDNAPTYVVFFETAKTLTAESLAAGLDVEVLQLANGPIRTDFLRAISLGAVFMGANTYIGNGPNFMVKSIAEEAGVKMPSFFGYMFYSCLILVPLFVAGTFLFLG
jgi:Na+/H+ antiporter NhaD/arsenite permease-like protein